MPSALVKCDYLFHVNDTYSIDAQNSTHFSRYFNHAEHGNLVSSTDEDELRVDFYAARDIAADEELTFDYGDRYWLWRDAPSADSDSRNFSEPKYRDLRPVEKTLLHPPPVGTVGSRRSPPRSCRRRWLCSQLTGRTATAPPCCAASTILERRGRTVERSKCRLASAPPPSGGRRRRPSSTTRRCGRRRWRA